jgi:hypothetical protein
VLLKQKEEKFMSDEFNVLNEIEGLAQLIGVRKDGRDSGRENARRAARPAPRQRPPVQESRAPRRKRHPQEDYDLYEDQGYDEYEEPVRPRRRAPAPKRAAAPEAGTSLSHLTRSVAQLAKLQESSMRHMRGQIDMLCEQMSEMIEDMTSRIEIAAKNLERASYALEEGAQASRAQNERRGPVDSTAFMEEDSAFLEEAIAKSAPLNEQVPHLTHLPSQRGDSED